MTAGDGFRPFYSLAVQRYPLLVPDPNIETDVAAATLGGGDGDAWCSGLDIVGRPILQCRADFVMDENTAMHEIGHAILYTLRARKVEVDWLAFFWSFMFAAWPSAPRTWQEARTESEKATGYMAKWQLEPIELWAEVCGMSLSGGWTAHSNSTQTGCKANDYGRLVLPADAAEFFHGLRRELQPDPVLVGWEPAGLDVLHTQFFWVRAGYMCRTDVFGSIQWMGTR